MEEQGWLIERITRHVPFYWTGKSLQEHGHGFSHDPNDAVRFAREEDALKVLNGVLAGYGVVRQHIWNG